MKTHTRKEFTLRSGRKQIRLGRRTLVMGVVNVTPDSFSDGGRHLKPANAVARGLELLRHGADWIDIGGESTRPGSRPVPVEEELRRVLPVVRGLRKKSKAWISIDTTKAEVAETALRAGANAINDVSGLRFDARMARVAVECRCPLILMHMRGTPATMQQSPFASEVWRSVRSGLKRSVQKALQAGVRRNQLIVDPGFGFGKSFEQNFELLGNLSRLSTLRLPILVGTSRKSFIRRAVGESDGKPSSQKRSRLKSGQEVSPAVAAGTAATVMAAILGGAHIVRVNDVKEVLPAVRIADAMGDFML